LARQQTRIPSLAFAPTRINSIPFQPIALASSKFALRQVCGEAMQLEIVEPPLGDGATRG
jgi:hypothetical protein